MNSKSIFKKAASKTKKTKKDATPEFNDPDSEYEVDLFIAAKAKLNESKAEISLAEASILPKAESKLTEISRVDGKFHSSVKLCISSEKKLTISFANKYSEIPTESEDQLRSVFSEEEFKKFFREQTNVTLTPVAMNDEEFIQSVIEKVGEDKFSQYFKVKQYYTPTKEYHEQRFLDEELGKKHKAASDLGLVSPNKPSVKIG